MTCLGCAAPTGRSLCEACAVSLSRAPDRWLGGVLVRSAMLHRGAARSVVHRLKYGALHAGRLGGVLAPLLPAGAAALVPVPRVAARTWRLGTDPARELAAALGACSGLPVIAALRPRLYSGRHAGSSRRARVAPRFDCSVPPPPGAVLVDDVVTTGSTLRAAAAAAGISSAVTLTSAIGP